MTAGLWFDWDNDGFATGASDECTSYLLEASYRRGGSAEITGGAQVGSATFVLRNTDDRFNPDNSSGPLYGKLKDGVPVWFGLNTDGTMTAGGTAKGRFAGRITDITLIPSKGTSDPATVEIVCEDALGWYGRIPVEVTETTAGSSPTTPDPVTIYGHGSGSGTTEGAIPGLPTGWQQDDLFFLFVETANQAASAPAGWTELTSSPQGTGTAGDAAATRLTVYWRRAQAGDGGPVVVDVGDHIAAKIVGVRGASTTGTPFAEYGNVVASPTTAISVPGSSASAGGLVLVTVSAALDKSSEELGLEWTNASLSDLTPQLNDFTPEGNGGGFVSVSGVMTSAGSFGATTATLSSASAQGYIVIVFDPAV